MGLAATHRDIAVRCTAVEVDHDDRVTDDNLSVIPVHMFDSTGWLNGVSLQGVIRAVKHATQCPPVLTRCFNTQGLNTWTLDFDTVPQITQFAVKINEAVPEVILTPPAVKTKAVKKGTGKGGSKVFQGSTKTGIKQRSKCP